MRLKFRDTAPSATPGFPFLAGQIVDVAELSPEMQAAIEEGKAELLQDDEPEEAVTVPAPERAVTRKAKHARGVDENH